MACSGRGRLRLGNADGGESGSLRGRIVRPREFGATLQHSPIHLPRLTHLAQHIAGLSIDLEQPNQGFRNFLHSGTIRPAISCLGCCARKAVYTLDARSQRRPPGRRFASSQPNDTALNLTYPASSTSARACAWCA
jgi:hypothetical protein